MRHSLLPSFSVSAARPLRSCSGWIARVNVVRVSRCRGHAQRTPGFSLVEVLVVLAIIGIFTNFAVPMMSDMMNNWRIRSAGEAINNALRLTRSEALRRGGGVRLVIRSATSTNMAICSDAACNAASTVKNIVEADDNRYTLAFTTDRAQRDNAQNFATALSGGTAPQTIVFTSQGRVDFTNNPATPVRIDILLDKPGSERRQTILIYDTGMTKLCDPLQPSTSSFAC